MTKKRSVLQVQEFVGWNYLEGLVNKAKSRRDKALVATLFNTGGRTSEVTTLTKQQFTFQDIEGSKYIVVKAMPILKKFHKERQPDGSFKTVKDPTYRSFAFPANEPLVKPMLEYLKKIKSNQILFPLSRQHVWRILVKGIDSKIWGHWFRSQRASQLAHEYGFNPQMLMEWFGWIDVKTAVRYSRLGYRSIALRMRR